MAVVRFTCPPPCGHTLSADGEEALVEAVREHARLVHGHELTPGDVRRLMAAHGQLPVRWHLAGTYIEHCSCHSVCPCTTSGLALPADTERCQAVAAWRIDRGAIGGLEVSGLSVAMLIDAPRYMGTPHSWRVGLWIDRRASPAQFDRLAALFAGDLGGPVATVAALLFGERLGVEAAPLDFRVDGRRYALCIGEEVEIEVEEVLNRAGRQPVPVQVTGLAHMAAPVLTVAVATRSRVRAFGQEFSFPGRNGFAARFAWSV